MANFWRSDVLSFERGPKHTTAPAQPKAGPASPAATAPETGATTLNPVSTPGTVYVTQFRTRERRYQFLVVLYLGSLLVILDAARQVWWTTVATVASPGVISHQAAALSPIFLARHGVMGQVAGVPTPVAYALAAAGLGIAGICVRSGVLGIPAAVCELLSWHALNLAKTAVGTNLPTAVGGPGLQLFLIGLAATAGALLVVSIQISWMNHRIHAEERAAAEAAGLPVTPNFLDMAHSFQVQHLARFGRGAEVMDRTHERP